MARSVTLSFAPLLSAPWPIQVHAFAAMGAFVLGIAQFVSPKGRTYHRIAGWTWVMLILVVAASSFWIHQIRLWGDWSPIHLISIYVLIALPLAVYAARRHQVSAHRKAMISIFTGGLVIAGLFTFVPGRIMHAVAFGP
jgi:uncharacterized membrane protein